MENDNTGKEQENFSPLLKKLKGENAFSTPEGYFETLPERIMEKAMQKPARRFAWITPVKALRPAILAVGVVFFAIISLLLLQNSNDDIYLSESDEAFFDDYLAWYSEYQTDVFYDIILAAENGNDTDMFAEGLFEDEEMIDYMMMHSDYYMDLPLFDEEEFW